jgi:acyl-CoA reductase-like NAD-dependent aldehyde dehydrogenase
MRASSARPPDEYIEPFGVVAGMISFSWPPVHFGGKVVPALAVGNAIVL